MQYTKKINYDGTGSGSEVTVYTFTESFICVQVVQLHTGAGGYGSFSITDATSVLSCTNVRQQNWDGRRCVIQTGIYYDVKNGSILKSKYSVGGAICCYN